MVMARIHEELDFLAISKKEEKLLLIGLESNVAQPREQTEAKNWLRTIVDDTVNMDDMAASHKVFTQKNKRPLSGASDASAKKRMNA